MLCVLGAIIALFTYWNLEGIFFHKVLDQDQITFQTTATVYKNGDIVSATFSACKNLDIAPSIQWSLIDTYLRTYPRRTGKNTIHGCVKDKLTTIEEISPTLPPDTYYFSGTATYKLNPIKTITVSLVSNRFEVK